LAKKFGIVDFPTPAGGCLLTEGKFSLRLKDLLEQKADPTFNDLALLKWGRHFRSSEGTKIVVSRDEDENEQILKLALPTDLIAELADFPGPTVVVRGEKQGKSTLMEAAVLTARYSKARNLDQVCVSYRSGAGEDGGNIVAKHPVSFLKSGKAGISQIDAGDFRDSKSKIQN
jgi:tRNA-specific 2-thiouridylase